MIIGVHFYGIFYRKNREDPVQIGQNCIDNTKQQFFPGGEEVELLT